MRVPPLAATATAGALLLAIRGTLGLDNGVGRRPVLGWNTWCVDGQCARDYCTATEVKQMADIMVSSGMRDLGFQYVNLDDCWGWNRTAEGLYQADPHRFPPGADGTPGMRVVADYLHERGLRFGLYIDGGTTTCSKGERPFSIPGSYGHWRDDADTFASWKMDYIKMDWCSSGIERPEDAYRNMSLALNATGHHMFFLACEWGVDAPWQWMRHYTNAWRATGDHFDYWGSTAGVIEQVASVSQYGGCKDDGFGCGWNYADFVMTGGQGCPDGVAGHRCPGMTNTEYITEATLWTIVASPLIVATDLRNMSAIQRRVLLNEDLLRIHQDPLGLPGGRVATWNCGDLKSARRKAQEPTYPPEVQCPGDHNFCNITAGAGGWGTCARPDEAGGPPNRRNTCFVPLCQIWSRDLQGGRKAVALYNAGNDVAYNITVEFHVLGWPNAEVTLYDVWRGSERGQFTKQFSANVQPHGVVLLQATLANTDAQRITLKTDDGAWINSTDGIHVHLEFDNRISSEALARDAHKFDFVFGAQRHHLDVYSDAKAMAVLTWYLPYSRDPGGNETWWRQHHPSWLLYECDKVTRAGYGYSNNALPTLDFSNDEVVDWQVSTFVEPAAKQGYHGIAIDNLGFHNAHRACGVWRDGKWVQLYSGELIDKAYETAVVKWTQRFAAGAHQVMAKNNKPMKVVPNFSVGGFAWNDSSTLAVCNATDGVDAEMGFTDNGGGPVTGSQWENILMHMINQQIHGKMYASVNQCANVTIECRQWAIASYLLGKGSSATVFVSGIQDYGKENYWPEYMAPVGTPLGPAVRTTTGLWYRRSTGGLAIVNPTQSPAVLPLTQDYVDLYGVQVRHKAGPLTVPAMTGRVLLNDSLSRPESFVPEQLHLALERNGSETLVLQWASRITTDPAVKLCSEATVSFGLHTTSMHATVRAECYPFDMRNSTFFAQANHVASLNMSRIGAAPGATVFYQILPANGQSSAVYNLTVPKQEQVSVAILGDLGTRTAGGEHVATALPGIHSAVVAGEVDWVLHLGDAAYDFDLALDADLCPAPGGATGRLFMNDIENISSRVPYMFLHGNHDKPYDFAYPTEFFRNMPSSDDGLVATGNLANPMAPNNWWFSWKVPGLATFVALSTEIYQCCSSKFHPLVSRQWAWLKTVLGNVNRDETPWLIVAGHRPLYCTSCGKATPCKGVCGGECNATDGAAQLRLGLRQPNGTRAFGLDKLLMTHGVDLYLAAHNHNYERMFDVSPKEDAREPWRSGASARTLTDMRAPVHVVEGGAGCSGHHEHLTCVVGDLNCSVPQRVAYRTTAIGYSRLTLANATHLRWRRISTSTFDDDGEPHISPGGPGRVVDDVWIVQHAHGPFE